MKALRTLGLAAFALTLSGMALPKVAHADEFCDFIAFDCMLSCEPFPACLDGCDNDWCYCEDKDPCP